MRLADRLIRQLKQSREFCERLLDAFKAPEDWTHQIAPGANHALWFAGHVTTADNFRISIVDLNKKRDLDGWNKYFGVGSKPTSNPGDYPPVAQVLGVMRERRATLLEILGVMTDADLLAPTPPDVAGFCPDYASLFEKTAWHEGMHAGQVTMICRAIGHAAPAPFLPSCWE